MSCLHVVGVGIDRYSDDRIPDLRFARSDAEQWVSLFKESAFARDVRSYLLLDEEATRVRIMDLLGVRLPLSVDEDDVVIVYFGGHGSPERDVRHDSTARFLVCHDTDKGSLFSSGMDVVHDLSRVLERIRVRVVLFVLDACATFDREGPDGGIPWLIIGRPSIIKPKSQVEKKTVQA